MGNMILFTLPKVLKFVVRILTAGGGRRDVNTDATSVHDAIDQTKVLYPNCQMVHVDVIVKKKRKA